MDALGFRRRSSETHFIHSTTRSVPSAPIPLFLLLTLPLPWLLSLLLYLSVSRRPRSSIFLNSSFFSMFVSLSPSLCMSHFYSVPLFLFVFPPFSHSSKCHAYIATGTALVSSVFLNFIGELKSKRGTKAGGGWVSLLCGRA